MTEAAAYAPGGAEERTGLTSAQSRSSQVHPEPNGGQAADGRLVAAPAPPQGAPQGGVDGVLPPPPEPLKLRVWKLFEDPQSSQAAFILALFLLTLILVSCLAFCLQTIGVFYAGDQTVWEYTEFVCIIAFTIEYLLRLMAAPHRMTFVKSGLNIIDLVAILPFYLEAMLSGTDVAGLAVFRIVRLARVFRLFKLGRYSDGLKTFATTMSQSTRPLAMLLFFMVIAIVLFSSAIYYVERGNWDEVRRVWWRDGNLGRAQGLNEEDDRLVFYTACAGTVDMTLNSSRLVNSTLRSSINVHFRTTAPFVGSGVAKRTVPKLAFRAGGGAQATDHHYQVPDHLVPLPDGALSANASAWVASQSWAAAMVTAGVSWDDFTFGADPWARATCRSDFPLDNEQEECFDERNNWPEIGTRAIVEHVKGLVVAKAGHNVSVVVSGLECEELGCLYCNNPSPFDSIPASFYWSAVTMTTVGYGDVFPVTWGGQLVACFTMMTGILILALPITVIGTYFAAEYEEYLRSQKIDKDYKARMEKIAEVEKESVQAGGADGAPAGPGSGVAGSGGGGGSSSGEQASSWLDHHEPVNVYDEMDWIAHRSRAELRVTLENIIRQERDNLVLKLNSVVQRYSRQTDSHDF